MRKLLCLMLVMLMAMPCAMAEDVPELHTLWDMPLDITIDEFEAFVEAETGTEMERSSFIVQNARHSPPFTLYDLPAKLTAFFDAKQPPALEIMGFALNDAKGWGAGAIERQFGEFVRLAEVLSETYGEPSGGQLLRWRSLKPGEFESYYTELPMGDGWLDFERAIEAVQQTGMDGGINVEWNNLLLSLMVGAEYRCELIFSVSATMPEYVPAIPFEEEAADAF